jgi:hypothetical protein
MASNNTKSKSAMGRFFIATGRAIKPFGIFLGLPILGFIAGVAGNMRFGPNNILLYINEDGKVSLSPQAGDVIRFASYNDKAGEAVAVNYTVGAAFKPCDTNSAWDPDSTCVYKPKGALDVYLFGCKSNGIDCIDPQYGPQCQGCGQGLTGKNYYQIISLLFYAVIHDGEGAFGLLPALKVAPQGATQPSGGNPPGQPQMLAVNASAPAALPQQWVAACYSGAPSLFKVGDQTPTDTTKAPIAAVPNDKITIHLYSPPAEYGTVGLSKVCSKGELSDKNQLCAVNNVSATTTTKFQLTMICTGSSPTSTPESISVTKQ